MVSPVVDHDTIIHDLSNVAISTQTELQRPIVNKNFDTALLGNSPLTDDIDMPSPIPRIPSKVIIKQNNFLSTNVDTTYFIVNSPL